MVNNANVHGTVYVIHPGDRFYNKPVEAYLRGIDKWSNTAILHDPVYADDYRAPLCNVFANYDVAEQARVKALRIA